MMKSFTVLILLVFLSSTSFAEQYTRAQIQQLAVEHATQIYPSNEHETLTGKASPIDARVKIKPCEGELSLTAPNMSSYSRNLTIRVRCLDEKGWSLYVPVKMQILLPILVATADITKGDTLNRSQIKTVMVDKSYMRNNSLTNADIIIGSKAKRPILAGQAILNTSLCFVCKGDLITIEANTKGLSVKTSGYAMTDGGFGDTINVKNRSSHRIVQGRVIRVGAVQIYL